MEDSEKAAISAGYQSFDSINASSHPTKGGGNSAIPSRYLTGGGRDENLAEDLRKTARRTRRRTTRKTLHWRIEADSDAGSDDSSIDEDYEVASITSSIEEGLT